MERSACHNSGARKSVSMSTIDMAIEKIRRLDEGRTRQSLTWLEQLEHTATQHRKPAGAMSMLGFGRFRSRRST
jgi:hypothetical protein